MATASRSVGAKVCNTRPASLSMSSCDCWASAGESRRGLRSQIASLLLGTNAMSGLVSRRCAPL